MKSVNMQGFSNQDIIISVHFTNVLCKKNATSEFVSPQGSIYPQCSHNRKVCPHCAENK